VPLFNAFDTLSRLLPVLANAIQTLKIHPERMKAGIDASMMATDLADYLVGKGVPFRDAHVIAGQAVKLAVAEGKSLDELSLAEYQGLNGAFGPDVYTVFDPLKSISRRNAPGGTGPEAVAAQLQQAKEALPGG